jgi:hypothetical protein
LLVNRTTSNHPFFDFPQQWVNPKKSNTSGLASPRLARFSAA